MEMNFRKLKLVTTSSYADIYVYDGETDQTEGVGYDAQSHASSGTSNRA